MYYPVCLGLKGDAPALAKAGYFNRYFANMGKNKGCCHECLAGLDEFPFEDVGPDAAWQSTVGLAPPWKESRVSPLSQLAGYKYRPEQFYCKDPFHIFKQSLGGHFVSSCIVLLACDLQLWPGRSVAVASALDRAYLDFEYYIKFEWTGKGVNHLKAFTKEVFHFPRVDSYPAARFKGSDTMLLCRWLRHLCAHGPVDEETMCRRHVEQQDQPFEGRVFKEIMKASAGAIQFFYILHKSGIWLDAPVAQEAATSVQDFCLSYRVLANLCFERELTRFRMEPCLHHFHHFAVEIRAQLSNSISKVFSPSVHLCEADEDSVGRICRGSRCVHMASMTQRTLDRYFIKLWFEFSGKK